MKKILLHKVQDILKGRDVKVTVYGHFYNSLLRIFKQDLNQFMAFASRAFKRSECDSTISFLKTLISFMVLRKCVFNNAAVSINPVLIKELAIKADVNYDAIADFIVCHECGHILNGDLDRDEPASMAEYIAVETSADRFGWENRDKSLGLTAKDIKKFFEVANEGREGDAQTVANIRADFISTLEVYEGEWDYEIGAKMARESAISAARLTSTLRGLFNIRKDIK